ncbi:myosin-11-like [Ostrea edulis]|uniref:myosin-11-like n=1 Tax=Ostrea edulis TaxID=37623 RepID=UPI0024AEC367|nr:myosin-11-like [Ostrea edulis]
MDSEEMKYLVVNRKEIVPSVQSDWASKKLIWVPHDVLSFCAAGIIGEEGDYLTVLLEESGKKVKVARDECQKMNPPKYNKVEDMSELVCLNDASVLFNIKDRYFSDLIYLM